MHPDGWFEPWFEPLGMAIAALVSPFRDGFFMIFLCNIVQQKHRNSGAIFDGNMNLYGP